MTPGAPEPSAGGQRSGPSRRAATLSIHDLPRLPPEYRACAERKHAPLWKAYPDLFADAEWLLGAMRTGRGPWPQDIALAVELHFEKINCELDGYHEVNAELEDAEWCLDYAHSYRRQAQRLLDMASELDGRRTSFLSGADT